MCPFPKSERFAWFILETKPTVAKQISVDGRSNVGQLANNVSATQGSFEPQTRHPPGREINVRFVSGSNRIPKQVNVSGDEKYLHETAKQSFTEFTYGDDDGGDESPADFEEERRREAQHHLDVFKVVPVTCD